MLKNTTYFQSLLFPVMLCNSSVINSLVCSFAVYTQPYQGRCQNEHSTSYPLDMVGGVEDGGGGRGRGGGGGGGGGRVYR